MWCEVYWSFVPLDTQFKQKCILFLLSYSNYKIVTFLSSLPLTLLFLGLYVSPWSPYHNLLTKTASILFSFHPSHPPCPGLFILYFKSMSLDFSVFCFLLWLQYMVSCFVLFFFVNDLCPDPFSPHILLIHVFHATYSYSISIWYLFLTITSPLLSPILIFINSAHVVIFYSSVTFQPSLIQTMKIDLISTIYQSTSIYSWTHPSIMLLVWFHSYVMLPSPPPPLPLLLHLLLLPPLPPSRVDLGLRVGSPCCGGGPPLPRQPCRPPSSPKR